MRLSRNPKEKGRFHILGIERTRVGSRVCVEFLTVTGDGIEAKECESKHRLKMNASDMRGVVKVI